MNTPDEIEAVLDRLLVPATIILASGQEHVPLLFRSDKLDRPFPIFKLPKDAWLKAQQQLVAEGPPGCFAVLIIEAWNVVYEPGQDPRKGDIPMPRDHPNRKECLSFSFVGADWQAFAHCPIHRGPPIRIEKAPLIFVSESNPEYAEFDGRMVMKPNKVQ